MMNYCTSQLLLLSEDDGLTVDDNILNQYQSNQQEQETYVESYIPVESKHQGSILFVITCTVIIYKTEQSITSVSHETINIRALDNQKWLAIHYLLLTTSLVFKKNVHVREILLILYGILKNYLNQRTRADYLEAYIVYCLFVLRIYDLSLN